MSASRSSLLLLLTLLGPVVSVARAAATEARFDEGSREQLVQTLRSLRDPGHPPVESLVAGMLPLAANHLPLLSEILSAREVPGAGEEPQVLSEVQRELILKTIAGLDSDQTYDFLQAGSEQAWTRKSAIARIDLLGAIGRRAQLAEVFEIASSVWLQKEPGAEQPATLRRAERAALKRALGSITRRDDTAFDTLKHRWPALHEELKSELIFALGASDRPQALDVLGLILRERSTLSNAALGQVSMLAKRHRPSDLDSLQRRIRPFLSCDDAQASAACYALASLEDMDAIPTLIELLEHEAPQVESAALAALRTLTGLPFAADVARWEFWYAGELRWMREEKLDTLRELHSRDSRVVARAASQLKQHPLVFEEVEASIEKLLSHSQLEIQVIGLEFAAERRLLWALPAMVQMFPLQSGAAGAKALEAARRLTGLHEPADSPAWENYLLEHAYSIENH